MVRKFLLPLLLVITALAGCGTVQQYEGPLRPKHEVATISKDSMRIHFRIVNGKQKMFFGNPIQVEPGPTEIHVDYQILNLYSPVYHSIKFNAEAGKDYMVDYWRDDMRWGVYLVDKESGRTIAHGAPDRLDSDDVGRDEELKKFTPPEKMAAIYVFRGASGMPKSRSTISINQKDVSRLVDSMYTYSLVPAGTVTLGCAWDNVDQITIDVKESQVVYVHHLVKFGMEFPRCKLEVVDDRSGKAGVMRSVLAKDIAH